jgi:hypothetical protein
MKKYLLSLILLLTGSIAIAQNKSLNGISTIDALDTLIFDIDQAVTQSGYVEFPVYFRSDDTVNAIDFSLKFNTANFEFDTIIRLAGYLQMTYNLTSDTTLYFTAYSLQRITNDTPLVKIRFNVLSGIFCSSDLNSVLVYLNGEACSKRITCTSVGVPEMDNRDYSFAIYPNPSTDVSTMNFTSLMNENALISVTDLMGRTINNESVNISAGKNNFPINLNHLSNGIYFLTLKSSKIDKAIRIIKQ